jgi:hypothetical protein
MTHDVKIHKPTEEISKRSSAAEVISIANRAYFFYFVADADRFLR